MRGKHPLDDRAGIEERSAVHARGAAALRHGDRAVGGGIDHGLPGYAVLEERQRRRMRKSGQGLGIELTRQDEGARNEFLAVGAGGGLVEHRHDVRGAVRERGHHRRGGKEDVQHHGHLARDAHRVELLLLGEDVDLVIEVDSRAH
jgi:hypothetical protein